jgi:rhodanese-related sulfurtransferase
MTLTHPNRALCIAVISCALIVAGCGPASSQSTVQNTDAPVINQTPVKFAVKHVNAQEASTLLAAMPETIVLDVRTPKEIKGGHIEGAKFANFYDADFAEQLTKLDRQTPYLIHCKGGGRSTKALRTLKELGFTNVAHMDGGLDGWKREKLPLTTP